MGKRRGAILALIAAALTAVFYGRTWRFDLQCDDLLVIRPWSRAELAAAWHSSWVPGNASPVFFRPVATWFYAGTFDVFGFNAPAHMLLSLAMLAAVAWLLALFIARESKSLWAGAGASLVYLVHPNVPWSTGTWLTNDFHKLTAISALTALVLWQRWRTRPAPSPWLLLAPFAIICFLVKEDGLMLIPALICMQWARARLVGDVEAPGLTVAAAAGIFGALLVLWRYVALRELGGFPIPPVAAMFPNLVRGPLYAFTLHGSLSVLTWFEKLTAIFAAGAIVAGIALMRRQDRFLPIAGLILMFWYDLPLALISNVTRYYMVTIASVVVAVPVFRSFTSAATRGRRAPALAAALMLLLLVVRTSAQARELNVFAPCGRAEHNCVPWVLDEITMLPAEARAYVADTPRACLVQSGPRPQIGATGTLTWGLGETTIDTVSGERSNLVTGHVVALIQSSAGTAAVAVRHPQASIAHPVRLQLATNGRVSSIELTTPEWQTIEVTLERSWRVWLRDAHRIDATFSAFGAQWKLLR